MGSELVTSTGNLLALRNHWLLPTHPVDILRFRIRCPFFGGRTECLFHKITVESTSQPEPNALASGSGWFLCGDKKTRGWRRRLRIPKHSILKKPLFHMWNQQTEAMGSMTTTQMDFEEKYDACARKDPEYDGILFMAVKTTGIFCRPTCPAKKPLRKNVTFYDRSADALASGYRACKRCRPMEVSGQMPDWLENVVENMDRDPARKWKDQDIRALGAEPKRVRRWFQTNHGITFHAFLRSRRLSTALARLSLGHDIAETAFDAGYESVSGFRSAFQNWFGCAAGAVDGIDAGIQVNRLLSPLGPLVIASDERQLFLLEYADRRMLETQFKRLSALTKRSIVPGENAMMQKTQRQLDEYFQGNRQEFSISLFMGGTDFQQSVWKELKKIEFGKTCSYESIAKRLGNPGAQRAVGKANGDNRIAIIIPCHRVIRSNGELSGYGGGVRRKEWMLSHEKAIANAK